MSTIDLLPTADGVLDAIVPSTPLRPTSPDELPDDVTLLKAMLWEAMQSNNDLTQQVAWLKRVLWGKKSERFVSPEQLALFEEVKKRLGLLEGDPANEDHETLPPGGEDSSPGEGASAATSAVPARIPTDRPKTRRGGKRSKPRGRFLGGTVPLDTPFVTRHICLDAAACPVCAKPLTLLGADSRKRVEFRPAEFFVLETIVETGICPEHPHESLFTPEGPEFIVPGGVLGNDLVCNVIVDKHADHIPLHRQSNRFARAGVNLPDATLSRNVIASASLARHIVDAMHDELVASLWLQGDATGLPILIGDLGHAFGAQLWVYSNGESAVFQVSMTKHAEFPKEFLAGFEGVWLADGTSSYNAVASLPGVERAGCWSHGRRYVFEARNEHVAAFEGLELIRDLFMTERVAMTLARAERLAYRTQHAAPLVARIRAWVDRWRADPDVVQRPKSAFAQALNYLHRQWAALELFLKRPEIEIHNNRSELLLRGPVIGRKAWLFAGSPEGADASAIWFSLVASCMLQGIDPLKYLRDVLPGLGKKTKAEIRELTPARWAAARRAEREKVA
jgi:transposase